MDYDKLIHCLKCCARVDAQNIGCDDCGLEYCGEECQQLCGTAATAISTLQAENEEMQKQLNEFSEFLCRMTGNLLSKTNYTAQAMISAAEDYQQRVCDNDCDLRADLARVTAERDALIKRTAGDCWSCIRRYECNSRKGPHSRCWEFDPWLLKEN